MNQYLLSVYHTESMPRPAPEALPKIFADVDAFNKLVQKEGAWVFAGGLHEPSSSTVVSKKGDEVLFTDGPFSESKEFIGGFWVIKAPDLDAALKWASKATTACQAPVEVRPFMEPAAE
jgi:hypothetical protein